MICSFISQGSLKRQNQYRINTHTHKMFVIRNWLTQLWRLEISHDLLFVGDPRKQVM